MCVDVCPFFDQGKIETQQAQLIELLRLAGEPGILASAIPERFAALNGGVALDLVAENGSAVLLRDLLWCVCVCK
jgi:hypothetical protein